MQDTVADKPGRLVPVDCLPVIIGAPQPFASRGGLKLDHALKQFRVLLSGKTAMDVGASTGGFTDCLLQFGADKVYAFDVGTNQLAWKLRSDERVISRENFNCRNINENDINDPIDIVVIDVSFSSWE